MRECGWHDDLLPRERPTADAVYPDSPLANAVALALVPSQSVLQLKGAPH
jgi:hypothetical protein